MSEVIPRPVIVVPAHREDVHQIPYAQGYSGYWGAWTIYCWACSHRGIDTDHGRAMRWADMHARACAQVPGWFEFLGVA